MDDTKTPVFTIMRRGGFLLCLLLAFLAGAAISGFFFYRQGPRSIGELDRRYAAEHTRAAETIGRLAAELERERDLNRKLRDHHEQAGSIAGELADSAQRNVTNLQEAISLISEIRQKFKVLAYFYSDSDSGDSGAQRQSGRSF